MGMNSIIATRCENGNLQTAVQRYTRSSDNRTITLIATVHLGEIDYFTDLRKLIDELSAGGAQVQIEGNALLDTSDLSDEQFASVQKTRKELSQQAQAIELLQTGLVHQLSVLHPAPDWVGSDVQTTDIVARYGTVSNEVLDPGAKIMRWYVGQIERVADKPNSVTRTHELSAMHRSAKENGRPS